MHIALGYMNGKRLWALALAAAWLVAVGCWRARSAGGTPRPRADLARLRIGAVGLVAVGDLMLARGVAQQAASHGWDYPFARVAPVIRSADLAVGNLECVLGQQGVPVPKRFSFSAPEEAAPALKRAGFDLLFLANNHTLDRGRPGLIHTMELLRRQGIAWAGAGQTLRAARQPVILERRGLKVAFLAYTCWLPESYLSLPQRPGIAFADPAAVQAGIRRARRRADVVVVSFHWGGERRPVPSSSQRGLAHLAVRAGADVVLGHHPHVRQPVEWYRGRPIFYSLGDFVFDQRSQRLSNGWLALLRMGAAGVYPERQSRGGRSDYFARSTAPRAHWIKIERLARVETQSGQPAVQSGVAPARAP